MILARQLGAIPAIITVITPLSQDERALPSPRSRLAPSQVGPSTEQGERGASCAARAGDHGGMQEMGWRGEGILTLLLKVQTENQRLLG